MRNTGNKVLIVFLVLLLAVCGTGFENLKAGTVFAHTASGESETAYLSSAESAAASVQPCTARMLGIREYTELERQTARLAEQRREFDFSPDFLCADIFSLKEERISGKIKESRCVASEKKKIVTGYIQKTDGKKKSINDKTND